ncbi:MAG: DUF4830 domain-containing protein [Candidatus Omnitrophica bacterium]|jgi:hypothetical protein|nr:DUF4830 domain-containing protein [Candidatus Omnitrophota bacterium]
MKKLWITAILVFMLMPISLLLASDKDVILAELERLNIQISTDIQPYETKIPTEFNGQYEAILKSVCQQGGYDISSYAGKKAMTVNLPIENITDQQFNIVVFSCEERIACAYIVDKDSVPGMFAVNEIARE